MNMAGCPRLPIKPWAAGHFGDCFLRHSRLLAAKNPCESAGRFEIMKKFQSTLFSSRAGLRCRRGGGQQSAAPRVGESDRRLVASEPPFQFTANGAANPTAFLETTTNPANPTSWTPLTSFLPTHATCIIVDTNDAPGAVGFCRNTQP